MKDNCVFVFDTTLRDGQQSPGAGMSFNDNIRYAEYADVLNVDVLEAGFPAASRVDYDIVRTISARMTDKGSSMQIAGLCQLREPQCIKTMEALSESLQIGTARVHIYVPVDPNLMPVSLGSLAKHPDKIIKLVYQLVSLAYQEGYEVEFSPEGYSRMGDNFDFTTELIRAAVSAGASIINCPDTIGGGSRREGEQYFVRKMQSHADIIDAEFPEQSVIWSAHCHNDFGLALENTMAAVFEGPARQIEACINGVGERAGNTSLEQGVMYIKQFGAMADVENPYYTNVNPKYLREISNFIAERMLPRQPHVSIVGVNAAKHTAGGHTNAILKNPLAYQPFDPKEVGAEISFVFGPLSGSNHAKSIIESHGFRCENEEKAIIAQAIKNYYADRRKGITDSELMSAYIEYRKPIQVVHFDYKKENKQNSLTLEGKFFDETGQHQLTYQAEGSALTALSEVVNQKMEPITIEHYQSVALSRDVTAMSKSTIIISCDGIETVTGVAEHNDIEISALMALIDAVNKAYIELNYMIKEEVA